MATQLGFLVNLNKCVGCKGCLMACKNEHALIELAFRRVIPVYKTENQVFGYLSLACNHCANPECIRVCPERCYRKRRDGIVTHNPVKCGNCQSCVGACPFRSPRMNPATKKPAKCSLCADRLDKGLQPVCVSSCIPGALQVIDLSRPLPPGVVTDVPGVTMMKLSGPSVRFILPEQPEYLWRQE